MSAIFKKRKIDTTVEKQILIGMITNQAFMENFVIFYQPNLFQLPFSKILAGWCWDYYQKYGVVPETDIQDIFREKAQRLEDTLFQAIEDVILHLSDDYDALKIVNHKRLLDKTKTYLRIRNIENTALEIQALVDNDKLEEAEQLITNFRQVQDTGTSYLSLFDDTEKIAQIVTAKTEHLFEFKGIAKHYFPPVCREDFIAFAGPEKRGKSWNLQEIGKQGTMESLKVVHFNFEMAEPILIQRYLQSFTGAPQDAEGQKELIPVLDCITNQYSRCRIAVRHGYDIPPLVARPNAPLPVFGSAPSGYKACTLCKNELDPAMRKNYIPARWWKKNDQPPLNQLTIIEKVNKLKTYFRPGDLRWVSLPSHTFSIKDIRNMLLQWEAENNWIPDIVITDYADLMIPDKRVENYRHGLDNIWSGHKRLAQEFHVAVFTATQTTASTYTKRIQQDDPSEDKRKGSHVDRMIALNQTEEDAKNNLMRWSTLFERKKRKTHNDLVILQHLEIGNPFLDCYLDERNDENNTRKKKAR